MDNEIHQHHQPGKSPVKMKGIVLTRLVIFTFAALFIVAFSGCNSATENRNLLTVDFQQDKILKYEFISSREIDLNLDPQGTASKSGKSTVQHSTETLVLTVSYKPEKVNPIGFSTIQATCESAKISRASSRGTKVKDAVESAAGKSFKLSLSPVGRVVDKSELSDFVKELGEKAFSTRSSGGRIKNPDMIGDFFATQWFLWDSISSIEKPIDGVNVNDVWQSRLSIPLPMVMLKSRPVTYTLKEVTPTEKGNIATITSVYEAVEDWGEDWPTPYEGSFQMRGTYGTMGGFKVMSFAGTGKQLFNVDKGIVEEDLQEYEIKIISTSGMISSLMGIKPEINIKQTISMKLLED